MLGRRLVAEGFPSAVLEDDARARFRGLKPEIDPLRRVGLTPRVPGARETVGRIPDLDHAPDVLRSVVCDLEQASADVILERDGACTLSSDRMTGKGPPRGNAAGEYIEGVCGVTIQIELLADGLEVRGGSRSRVSCNTVS